MGGHAVSLLGGAIHFRQKIITLVVRLRLNHGHARYLKVRIKYGNKFIVNCRWSSFFFPKKDETVHFCRIRNPSMAKWSLRKRLKTGSKSTFEKKSTDDYRPCNHVVREFVN